MTPFSVDLKCAPDGLVPCRANDPAGIASIEGEARVGLEWGSLVIYALESSFGGSITGAFRDALERHLLDDASFVWAAMDDAEYGPRESDGDRRAGEMKEAAE